MNRAGCCCEHFSAPDELGRTVTRERKHDCCPRPRAKG